MGRKSTKENKNKYQVCREALSLTREKASEKLGFISASRIEKIESEKTKPQPDEVLAMSKCYKSPSLCNYYCANECAIGIKNIPEVKPKDLSQITLNILASLNTLNEEKNRLIDITVDGVISEDEKEDFERIKSELNQISIAVNSLSLWVEEAIIDGKIK